MTSDPRVCFHCGEANLEGDRYPVSILGESRAMCCPGCQAVAETIVAAGLEYYYEQRFACATRPSEEELEQVLAQADNLTGAELEQPWVKQAGEQREALLRVDNITCVACAWLIEKHLKGLPGITAAKLNMSTHELLVQWCDGQQSLADIVRALAGLGYGGRVRQPDDMQTQFRREHRRALGRLAVGGFGSMQTMMYAVGLYFGEGRDMDAGIEVFLRWVSLLVTIPVVTYAAWPFHSSAWRSLRNRRLTMDVPVSLAITIAFGASVVATFGHMGEVYFESVCMFIFFISIGRFLEMLVRHRAAARNDRLSRFAPVSALRLTDAGEERVPLSVLRPGDQVLIKPGTTIPADGVVVSGRSSADESFLTGESEHQEKLAGSRVLAGSINGSSPMTVEVTASGTDTVFAGIQHLQFLAQSHKPHLARAADRLAGWFIGALLLVAVVVGGVWLHLDPQHAVWVLVAVLVATCPCALTLATSSASAASASALAGKGFFLTGDTGLETLAWVTDVVFDKTGTLTDGRWQLDRVLPLGPTGADEARALAAALERHSEHPLAHAFAGIEVTTRATDVEAVPGQGLSGRVDGRLYRLGKPEYALPSHHLEAPEQGNSAILLADEQGPLAWFVLREQMRDSAAAAVAELRAQGVQIHLISGDQSRAVGRVAQQLGITRWLPDCSPDSKLAYVQWLQERGHRVMMVGDGVNDGPVLGASDLSVAMSGGADLAREGADAVLVGGDLRNLALALAQGRKTLRIIKENLAWALGYNLCVLPLAATGWLTPWMAAAGMSASSLLVVLNALRLNRLPGQPPQNAQSGTEHEHYFLSDTPESDTAGARGGSFFLGHEKRPV